MADALIKQYREMAALGGNFRGLSLLQHADAIEKVIKRHKARTLLDYGSGAGDAYRNPHKIHHQWGLNRMNVRLYDPAFPKNAAVPSGEFDGVICSDVLEHVPEGEVNALIIELFRRARLFVWASVCCRPAKKCFADGTNMHVTQQPLEWWRERFIEHSNGKTFYLVETP